MPRESIPGALPGARRAGRVPGSRPPCSRRRGAAAPALLFWILAILLFVVPFLRSPDAPDWEGSQDPRRRENWPAADQPPSELDLPFWAEVERMDAEQGDALGGSLQAHIEEASEAWFGLSSEALQERGVVELRRMAAGKKTYDAECAGCHGAEFFAGQAVGDGAGPAARFLSPRPRNFRKGMFKFASTQTGERPLREDIYRVVSYGLAGASMPDFLLLTEERRHDVVEYVRYISMRGEFEELLMTFSVEDGELADPADTAELVWDRWDEGELNAVFPTTAEPEMTAETIERGRVLYMDSAGAGCVGCHGETGVGDGPSAEAFLDGWGYPIKPRDFTDGVYRAGSTNVDLWVTIAKGINGTPMGSFVDSMSSEDIWCVVHFVRSLEKTAGGN